MIEYNGKRMETIVRKMVRIEGEREWMKTVIIVCTNQEEMKSASEWVCVCGCKMRECVCKQSAQQLVQTIQWTLFSEIQISFYFLCCCKSGVTCECVRCEANEQFRTWGDKAEEVQGLPNRSAWICLPSAPHIRKTRACHPTMICLL